MSKLYSNIQNINQSLKESKLLLEEFYSKFDEDLFEEYLKKEIESKLNEKFESYLKKSQEEVLPIIENSSDDLIKKMDELDNQNLDEIKEKIDLTDNIEKIQGTILVETEDCFLEINNKLKEKIDIREREFLDVLSQVEEKFDISENELAEESIEDKVIEETKEVAFIDQLLVDMNELVKDRLNSNLGGLLKELKLIINNQIEFDKIYEDNNLESIKELLNQEINELISNNDKVFYSFFVQIINEFKLILNENQSKLGLIEEKIKNHSDNELQTFLINTLKGTFLNSIVEEVKNQLSEVKEELKYKIIEIEDYIEKFEENAITNKIMLILDLCDQIKINIDLLEKSNKIKKSLGLMETLKVHQGIRTGEKVKVLMTGGFSAGKTTFINRLLSKVAGVRSSFPQTSSLITHKSNSTRSIKIEFNDEFEIDVDEKMEFSRLLRGYDFDKKFHQRDNIWNYAEDEPIYRDNMGIEERIDLIKRFEEFPGTIKRIDIGHKIRKRMSKQNILEYVELHDLPGLGGKKEHNEYLNNFFNQIDVNLIIYLIDTNRGVPSAEELETLIAGLKDIDDLKDIKFCWVYQKSNNNDLEIEESWIKEKREDIKNLIMKLKEENLDKQIIDYLDKAKIYDARGDETDSIRANEIFSSIIGEYFIEKTKSYIKGYKNILSQIPDLPKLIFDSENNIQNPIDIIIDEIIKLSNQDYIDYQMIDQKLNFIFGVDYISEQKEKIDNNYLSDSISRLKNDVVETIKEIINESNQEKNSFNFMKKFNFNKNPDLSKNPEMYNCDFNFLKMELKNKLYSNKEWQKNLFLSQSLLLLTSYHNKLLPSFYLNDLESSVITNIENNIKKLNENILL